MLNVHSITLVRTLLQFDNESRERKKYAFETVRIVRRKRLTESRPTYSSFINIEIKLRFWVTFKKQNRLLKKSGVSIFCTGRIPAERENIVERENEAENYFQDFFETHISVREFDTLSLHGKAKSMQS